jgi:hypothetical protein
MEKNHKNAEVRYTTGTRNDRRLRQNGTEHKNPMDVQEEIDRLRDAHRRTALALLCQLLRDDPSLIRVRKTDDPSPGDLTPKTLLGSFFDSLQVETQSWGVNASGT